MGSKDRKQVLEPRVLRYRRRLSGVDGLVAVETHFVQLPDAQHGAQGEYRPQLRLQRDGSRPRAQTLPGNRAGAKRGLSHDARRKVRPCRSGPWASTD